MNTPTNNESYISHTSIGNKEIMSFREAASYLDVSESLLYKLTSKKQIRFYKPNNGKIYFKRVDLNNWMLQNESGKA